MRGSYFKTLYLCGVLFLTSCTNYYIPVDSFKQQFGKFKEQDMREVTTAGPVGDRVTYKTYPVNEVKCLDKKGKPYVLYMKPSLEMRITDTNNKKTIFYLDRTHVADDAIYGSESRIMGVIKKSVPLSAIRKIEVQDGGKRYKYVSK